MKILFDHPQPFRLAHGGFQVQIEQTRVALEKIGVEVDFLRWWDARQTGDLIHYFGTAANSYLHHARLQKLPVAMTTLFTETCNRSSTQLQRQGWLTRLILGLPFGEGVKEQLTWRAFHRCDRNIVGLQAERRVLETVHRVAPEKISVVPLGLSDIFLEASPASRDQAHLVCVGTITGRKNCVPLARLARQAQVPVLFVGNPYATNDPYWREFQELVDERWVRHQPHLADPAALVALLQHARGAVMMSQYENWCLAAHEAAACGLPLLLPPLPWARECFGDQASYFTGDLLRDATVLREFFDRGPSLPAPKIRHYRWTEVAGQLRQIYEAVLSTSR